MLNTLRLFGLLFLACIIYLLFVENGEIVGNWQVLKFHTNIFGAVKGDSNPWRAAEVLVIMKIILVLMLTAFCLKSEIIKKETKGKGSYKSSESMHERIPVKCVEGKRNLVLKVNHKYNCDQFEKGNNKEGPLKHTMLLKVMINNIEHKQECWVCKRNKHTEYRRTLVFLGAIHEERREDKPMRISPGTCLSWNTIHYTEDVPCEEQRSDVYIETQLGQIQCDQKLMKTIVNCFSLIKIPADNR